MGRVQRYKKYKRIDPFHKHNLSHSEQLSPVHKVVDTGLHKRPKRKRKDADYDRCPDACSKNQIRKPFVSHCAREKERPRKKDAQGTTSVEKIKLRPGESRKQYFRRLDKEVGEAMQKAMMDTKAIRHKRKQHLKQRDQKKKESKKNREEGNKPIKKPNQEIPKFGEVAEAPPDLPLPRKASDLRGSPGLNLALSLSNGDKKELFTLSKKKRKLMTEEQKHAFDAEREDVIKKYRALKARTEFKLKNSTS